MGRMLMRAVQAAGLSALLERAMAGVPADETDRSALDAADVLVVMGMADAVRARFRGDNVRLFEGDPKRQGVELCDATVDLTVASAVTGQEALKAIAISRLLTPGKQAVGVCWDRLGFELAQTALVFGADVLWGQLARAGSLPLMEPNQLARREALSGLVERAGRRPLWHQAGPSRAHLSVAQATEPLVGALEAPRTELP